jgi:hypothetical protein
MGKGNSAAFADWTSPTEWASRLSQNNLTGNDYIRKLTVIADKPAPTSAVKDISADRQIAVDKAHTLNVEIDETNSVNYEWLRTLECGKRVRIWFETKGGLLFGGNEGILVNVTMDPVFGRGTDEILKFIGAFTWKSKFSPERCVSPVFGTTAPSTGGAFDTTLEFDVATEDTEAGVTGTVAATDADQLFEFTAITPRIGTPMSMSIKVAGVEEVTIDFTSDYLGQAFRYTDKAAVVHNGAVFTNGEVNF